jgi:uncharacterized membrane protein YciS (DUF1049 family)
MMRKVLVIIGIAIIVLSIPIGAYADYTLLAGITGLTISQYFFICLWEGAIFALGLSLGIIISKKFGKAKKCLQAKHGQQ